MRAKVLIAIIIALGAVFASFLVLILLLNLAPVQKFAIKTLEPILPWELSWDKLSIEAIGGAITVEGLKARGKDGRFFLDVDSARARLRPWHLLRGKLVFSPVAASHCTIRQIPLKEKGKQDLEAVGKKFQEMAGSLLLGRMEIREGTIGPFSFELEGRYTYSFDMARFAIDASLWGASHSEATVTQFVLSLPNSGRLQGRELGFKGSLDPGLYLSSSDDIFLKGLLSLQDGAWDETPLGDLEIDADLSHERFKLKRFESILADGVLSLSGTLEGLNLPASPWTAKATYTNEIELAYPIDLTLSGEVTPGQILIKSCTLQSGPATLTGQGMVHRKGGALDLKVDLQGLDTHLLFAHLPEGFFKTFGAVAQGQGTIGGTLKDPKLEMAVDVTDASYLSFRAADGKGTLTMHHRQLRFEASGEIDLKTPLKVTGALNFASRPHRIDAITIEAQGHPLEKIIPSLKQTGTLSGRLVLKGPMDHVTGEGELTATDLHFGPVDAATLTAQMRLVPDRLSFLEIVADPPILGRTGGRGTLDIDFKTKGITLLKGHPTTGVMLVARYLTSSQIFKLDDLKIENPYGTLKARGDIGTGGSLDLDIRGTLDLKDLTGLTSLVREGEGSAELALKARGTAANPLLSGEIALSGTLLTFSEWGYALGPLSGTIRFTPTRYELADLKIGINDGWILANGTMGAANLHPQSFQLTVAAGNFPWSRPGELRLLLDADLNVTGPLHNALIGGHASITEGRYYREFKITELLLKPLQREAPKEESSWWGFKGTHLDVTIDQTGDLDVKNNVANIALKTNLHLRGTLTRPRVEGSIQTQEGQIFYLGTTFNILSGHIDFIDPERINPNVEIRAGRPLAGSTGPTRSLEIVFKGPLDNLQLVLPPNVDRRDFFNLLAFGYTEEELKRAGVDRGGYVASGVALGELSRSVEGPLGRYTSLDVVRLGAADVKRRDAISQLTLGKNVSDRLLLEFLTEIAPQDAQKTVGATYFLTDNIQLKGIRTGSPRTGGIYQVNLSLEFEYR